MGIYLAAFARHALGFLSSYLVTKGILSGDQAAELINQATIAVGAVGGIATIYLSIKDKKKAV